jgi:serine/threonine protein kinase
MQARELAQMQARVHQLENALVEAQAVALACQDDEEQQQTEDEDEDDAARRRRRRPRRFARRGRDMDEDDEDEDEYESRRIAVCTSAVENKRQLAGSQRKKQKVNKNSKHGDEDNEDNDDDNDDDDKRRIRRRLKVDFDENDSGDALDDHNDAGNLDEDDSDESDDNLDRARKRAQVRRNDNDSDGLELEDEYEDEYDDEEGEEGEEDEEDEEDLGEWQEIWGDDEYFVPRCPEDWTVGKYRICERLQWGGFGSVFAVRQRTTNAPFALKVYRVDTEENVEREHRLLLSIRHENVMSVSAVRSFQSASNGVEYSYAVMPLYPQDLAQFIHVGDGEPPTGQQIYDIMTQVCGGLGAIHATRHAHADLKPENILVDPATTASGKIRACICDFGSVLDLSTGGPYDEFGHTLMLSAPELVCNCAELIGTNIDVFALGCVYTELCTGQVLFHEKKHAAAYLALVADANRGDEFPLQLKKNRTLFNRRGFLVDNAAADQAGKMDKFFASYELDKEECDFIRRCCRLDPAARPTLAQTVAWLDSFYTGDAPSPERANDASSGQAPCIEAAAKAGADAAAEAATEAATKDAAVTATEAEAEVAGTSDAQAQGTVE